MKHNPGFLTDDELVASFCVRSGELDSILEMLRECDGSSNPHRIVLGPRGCGKTSLLLRVAAEIRRTPDLSSSFFPVVFAEESYEVATAGEFWLEALSRLAAAVPRTEVGDNLARTFGELRSLRDDRMLRLRCLGALLDFADREDRRLVLMVENLNMMFRDMADEYAGWQLRETLQTEPRIVMLASATSRFDEIDNPGRAFYDLFTRQTLRPLDMEECAILWETVSGQRRPLKTIGALRILTGGSPRLLTIVARFGAGLSFRELMDDLHNLVDDHTEYFRSHIEALPAQERRVYLALADLWEPASAREVAERARLDTSKCSAQLKRLIDRGVVEIAGGGPRRKLYYLAERLYNIYYLMRRSREPDRVVKALIRFMAAYYSPSRLRDLGAGIAREAGSFDAEMEVLHREAFGSLFALPVLAPYRDELLSMVSKDFAQVLVREVALPDGALGARSGDYHEMSQLWDEAKALLKHERFEDTLSILDEIERRLNEGELPVVALQATTVLLLKGLILSMLVGREEEALAACDEAVRRFGDSESADVLRGVASALDRKVGILGAAGREEEALVACDEVVRRFGDSESPGVLTEVANALDRKVGILGAAGREEEALVACDEVVRRFGGSESAGVLRGVANALDRKVGILGAAGREEEALVACDEVVRRFGGSESAGVLRGVASALDRKVGILGEAGREEEALVACDEVVRRFGDSESPGVLTEVANALDRKVGILGEAGREEEALVACDEVVRRFGGSESAGVLRGVASALDRKVGILGEAGREEEALVACDEVVRRFGDSESPGVLREVASALDRKVGILGEAGREEEALVACDEVVRRFGDSESPGVLREVASALDRKVGILGEAGREEEAFAACDEVVRRFGDSESADVLRGVASALDRKVGILGEAGREEEAFAACDEVVHRFGDSESPGVLREVVHALLRKVGILGAAGRKEEAFAACDEVVRRFGDSESPGVLQGVAASFVYKGLLDATDKPEEALAACDEVVRRFGDSEFPDMSLHIAFAYCVRIGALRRLNRSEEALIICEEIERKFWDRANLALRLPVALSLLHKAEINWTDGNYSQTIEATDRLLERCNKDPSDQSCQALLIRARARLAVGDLPAAEQDLLEALAMLPEFDSLLGEGVEVLMAFCVELGPARSLDIVSTSPSAPLLLPLTTALERELGKAPRVAREVEEIAEDIRRDLEERRRARQ